MKHRLLSWGILAIVIALPVGFAIVLTGKVILAFVFLYPLLMSGMWMIGGLAFYLQRERRWPWGQALCSVPCQSCVVIRWCPFSFPASTRKKWRGHHSCCTAPELPPH